MNITNLGNGTFSYNGEGYSAGDFKVLVSINDASVASDIYDKALSLGFGVENNHGSQTELSVNISGGYREIVVSGSDELLETLQSLSE